MASIPINIAVEDPLSEVVLRRLIEHVNRDYFVGTAYGQSGFGYLKRTVAGWNAAARGVPFVLLTDLDEYECPSALISDWLRVPVHPNLIFRVAVKEVESWLLADAANLASYLAVSESWIPGACEAVADPKAKLVALGRRSHSREIRERIAPRAGSTAKQGPDYNGCLSTFVRTRWNIESACEKSRSLQGAVNRLVTFQPVWAEAGNE